MKDVIIAKVQSVQLCVFRAREEFSAAGDDFLLDWTRQDAAVMNVIRGCEQVIDIANHVLREYQLGIPTETANSFELLERKGIINREMYEKMRLMVGFRNKAVHNYKRLDSRIIISVIEKGLNDLIGFCDAVLDYSGIESLDEKSST